MMPPGYRWLSIIHLFQVIMSSSNYTILFHGNCIDGWFSAYIACSALTPQASNIKMYPISPSQTNTWPTAAEMAGTHILLVDVSVAQSYRTAWAAAGSSRFDVPTMPATNDVAGCS